MARNDGTLRLIHEAGADPEATLAASQLAYARQRCLAGHSMDCRWLQACGLGYLSLIVPAGADERIVYAALLDGIAEPSEHGPLASERFVQLCLNLTAAGHFESNIMESNTSAEAEHHRVEHWTS